LSAASGDASAPARTGRPRVLVAMSGGVDSSVAAALLLEQGYDVVGVFMRLGSPGETLDELAAYDTAGVACDPAKVKIGHQGCCSINDAADARAVAAELGIPFYVCNFKKDFARIIDYFVDEYTKGRTPNPCVRCNDWLKFGKLHDYAKQIGATHVASGHYARIAQDPDDPTRTAMFRGRDHAKDQSYVLFGMPRAHLARTLFPLGDFETKDQVRAKAHQLGLPVFDKPDSQEICFIPDNDYAGLVERRRPAAAKPGPIIDSATGAVIGQHTGQHRFTVGQRRGVGVALGYPLYVVEKDPRTNAVVVGQKEDLLTASLIAGEANWLIDPSQTDHPRRVLAVYRAHGHAVPATLLPHPDLVGPTPSTRTGAFELTFDEPQTAVAPGQAIVLYDADHPDRVLGGGWIAQTTRPV